MAKIPRPPALDTAAASSGVPTPVKLQVATLSVELKNGSVRQIEQNHQQCPIDHAVLQGNLTWIHA